MAQTVPVTIAATSAGRAFTVSGTGCDAGAYITPQTLQWTPGSSCSVAFVSPHSVNLGIQFVFNRWQDGNASNPRSISTPAQATTYNADFSEQVYITAQANPSDGGTISGGGWVSYGGSVTLSASANPGYSFVDWSGLDNASTTANPVTIPTYAPRLAIANFSLNNALPSAYLLTQVTSYSGSASINNFGQVVGAAWEYPGTRPFLWTPSTANAPVGSIVELTGVIVGNSAYSGATAVNDRGQVVGWNISNSQSQRFLWTPNSANGQTGSMIFVAAPDTSGSQTAFINNFGQIGGLFDGRWGIWTPSVANGTTGTFTAINAGAVWAINNFGQVILTDSSGYPALFTPSTPNRAAGTTVAIAGLSGGVTSSVRDINSKGAIAGYTCFGANSWSCQNHGFIWTPSVPNGTSGNPAEIPLPSGFVAMTPTALNDRGDVIGTMVHSNGTTVPFLFTGGKVFDLRAISGLLNGATPTGINEAGQIIFTTNYGLYLGTPVKQLPMPVGITITSVPLGVSFSADGMTYVTPNSFQWIPGSTHRVTFSSVLGTQGGRLALSGWSDGESGESRLMLVPYSSATFAAVYVHQYQLSTAVSPNIGGLLIASPSSSDAYYNEGTSVRLTAIANSAYQFVGFTGALMGSVDSQSLVMSGPQSVTATFAPVLNPSLTLQLVNDASKAAQPGPSVTAAVRVTNSGPGSATQIQFTSISARILAPAPGSATVNKPVPVSVGNLPPGATSGTVYIPMVLPDTARRIVLQISGTVLNSAGRSFTFSTSITILR